MSGQHEPVPTGLHRDTLEPWLLEHVGGLRGPLRIELISGGHSNLTYFVTGSDGWTVVLRRPPLRTRPGTGHDMARERTVIEALRPTAVPVPRVLAHCDDDAVNGAPFYVMSRVPGHVIENPARVAEHLPGPESRWRAGEELVDVMAAIHLVDIDAVGLGALARRDGFLDRQLKRIKSVWEQNQTRDLPAMDEVHAELVARRPVQRYTGIVHSDYRMGNVMFAESGDLTGVLDWELWTLGDPLADLGFLLNNWSEPGERTPQVLMQVAPTMAGGFPSRAEVVARYADRTGFDVSDVDYYRAFQHWKVAAIAEGVKRRYEQAEMASRDVDFDHLSQRVIDMAALAAEHLERIR